MLTGTDLLAKVKELGDASKSDLVRSCGYVSTKKDGTERLNFTAFYEALLEAKGVVVGPTGKGGGKTGRKLSYTTKVQFNGNLMVGKAYTTLLGLQPGDEFEIKLGRKQIKLIPIGAADEDVDATESEITDTDEAVSPLTAESTTDPDDIGWADDDEDGEDDELLADDDE
jgi:hypothetical protein